MAEAEYAPEGNTSSATLVPGTSDTSSFRKRKAAEMEAASIEAGGTIGQGTDEAAPAPIKAPRADSAAASDEGAVEGTEGSTTMPQPFRVETVEKGDEDPAQPFQPQTDTASSVTPISHWGNDPTTPGHADMQNESDDSIERVVRDRQTEQSVHPDFTHGDFCLISNDDIAFHVESVIFRSMFAASTGEARTHLTGANEAAADLAPFLKLVTGDMTPLQDHRLEPFKSLYSLVDKYECPSLRALLRSQMVLLNSCSQNSRIGIFLLAASDGNWPACAEALRTAQLGGKWANGGIPPRCVACCGKCKTPTGGIGLTSPDLKQTLLDPASLCVEHFAALTRYPAVLLALLRAIEFSKSRYTKVSHSAVSAMFLHLMMEHEQTSVGKTTRTRPTNDFYDHPLPACDEACNDHDETITL